MSRLREVFWAGRRRWITTSAALVLVLGSGVILYVDEQHAFDLRTETFMFESGDNELAATLHLPTSDGRHGLVVFIPGDGTADADPGALPVWEALAEAGYATVKWDKPGVGNSTGNWLEQDMNDRASEAVDAIEALADRDDLDTDDLGIVGVSQGGWVIPLVADRLEVDFFVAWSTAIRWVEQGHYLTERRLISTNADAELAERVRRADRQDRGDTYQDYLDWHASLSDDVGDYFSIMSEDRWQFAVRNNDLDARETLTAMLATPVLLVLGGRDDNVDVDDTERVYQEILGGPCLHVERYPEADHQLLVHEGLDLTLTGIFEPRSVFADGFLDDLQHFAQRPHDC